MPTLIQQPRPVETDEAPLWERIICVTATLIIFFLLAYIALNRPGFQPAHRVTRLSQTECALSAIHSLASFWMPGDFFDDWYPRQESNLYFLVRNEVLYPLSYGGISLHYHNYPSRQMAGGFLLPK